MSGREKIQLISAVWVLILLVAYVIFSFKASGPDVILYTLKVNALILTGLISVEIILSTIDRCLAKKIHRDERDVIIDSKANNRAFGFLSIAVIFLVLNISLSEAFKADYGINPFVESPAVISQVLTFVVLLSASIRSISKGLSYWRGGI